jgi:tetrahydromethanopterin S-methyltransferase subunit G
MTTEVILSAGGILATALVGLLAWSMRRNINDIDRQVNDIATDVRQLAAQTGRHGEALAGGVVKFSTIEKRLDKLEDKQERFAAECAACQREGTRG